MAINKGAATATLPIPLSGGTARNADPWLSSADQDMRGQAVLPVASGMVTARLPNKSVTTLVGK